MERSCGGTAVTSNQGQFPSPSQQRTGTSQGQTHTPFTDRSCESECGYTHNPSARLLVGGLSSKEMQLT
ncbi:unnamed protein product [Gadus morhua 'NCC']